MPFYEYRCEKGHTFEVMQKMTDDPVTTCQTCDAKVQRVFHPVAVHFKGSGFYNTDYGKKKTGAASETKSEGSADSKKSDSGSSDAGSSSKDSKSSSKTAGSD
jgi:putative FmdB family regulatory protein